MKTQMEKNNVKRMNLAVKKKKGSQMGLKLENPLEQVAKRVHKIKKAK